MPDTKQPIPSEESGKRLTPRLVSIGQIAGAISALVGLGVVIVTHLPSGGSPPAVLRAKVHVVTHAPRTFHTYLNDVGKLEREERKFRSDGLSQAEVSGVMQTPGVTIEYTPEIEAQAGSEYHVNVEMLNATTEEPIKPELELVPSAPLVISAGKFQKTFSAWMEYPPHPGAYFIEVDLLDKGGGAVGEVGKSGKFRVPS